MGRIRTVKPELFLHEDLYDTERTTGLPIIRSFIGLLTVCDRAGRFLWRPRMLKTQIAPYDEIDFIQVLAALGKAGFVQHYIVEGKAYGCIPTWPDHQTINNREAESKIPPPPAAYMHDKDDTEQCTSMHVHAQGEGKGKEGKGKEGKGRGTERKGNWKGKKRYVELKLNPSLLTKRFLVNFCQPKAKAAHRPKNPEPYPANRSRKYSTSGKPA